ncbi:hypothetical protein GUJ93_ZPchr0003g18575 [Zizania palustris]|uniref:Uncharacterized protein n=1 Tax=Zizania palustris TaxID=103762 RepID=A0A8J5VXK9_ZIZPA|nr:hypothetical protein GUJ93_ZPchr0003g18575 [Zizania palustris]
MRRWRLLTTPSTVVHAPAAMPPTPVPLLCAMVSSFGRLPILVSLAALNEDQLVQVVEYTVRPLCWVEQMSLDNETGLDNEARRFQIPVPVIQMKTVATVM